MKILRVIGSADPRGGGPIEGVLRSSEAMSASGHVNEIACLDQPDDAWVSTLPLRTHALGHVARKYAYSPAFVGWLAQERANFDAIIVHGVWNYSSLGVWRALAKTPSPYFVFAHGMLDPWFLTQRWKGAAKRLYWNLLESRVLRDAAAVLFTSEEEMRQATLAFPGTYTARTVAYGAADAPAETSSQAVAFARATPGLGERPFLLFIGRIHPKKGCDLLLRAFAATASKRPDIDLVMAGPDQVGWRSELEAMARRLGVAERIHWTGMIEGEAKWGAFWKAEALVLPSHSENFGIVVAEAMACGLPVLISDKVNIWREIERCGAGIVVPDDLIGVTIGLERLLAQSPEGVARMRRASRRCFLQHFHIRKSAESILSTIEESLR